MWTSVISKEKIMSLDKSNRQSITIYYIYKRGVAKIVNLFMVVKKLYSKKYKSEVYIEGKSKKTKIKFMIF